MMGREITGITLHQHPPASSVARAERQQHVAPGSKQTHTASTQRLATNLSSVARATGPAPATAVVQQTAT